MNYSDCATRYEEEEFEFKMRPNNIEGPNLASKLSADLYAISDIQKANCPLCSVYYIQANQTTIL